MMKLSMSIVTALRKLFARPQRRIHQVVVYQQNGDAHVYFMTAAEVEQVKRGLPMLNAEQAEQARRGLLRLPPSE